MIHSEINSSFIIAFMAFTVGLLLIASTYGRQMLKERWQETGYPEGTILTTDVYHYFEKQGYKVSHISAEKDTNNWYVFIIENKAKRVVKVLTDGVNIVGHEFTLLD